MCYRYAGMLDKSAEQCNAARQLDPGNFSFRSCAWTFLEMGKNDRALDFIQLDAGSEWAAWVTPYVYLAQGNVAEAHAAAKNMGKAVDLSSRLDGGLHGQPASAGPGKNRPRERELRS